MQFTQLISVPWIHVSRSKFTYVAFTVAMPAFFLPLNLDYVANSVWISGVVTTCFTSRHLGDVTWCCSKWCCSACLIRNLSVILSMQCHLYELIGATNEWLLTTGFFTASIKRSDYVSTWIIWLVKCFNALAGQYQLVLLRQRWKLAFPLLRRDCIRCETCR